MSIHMQNYATREEWLKARNELGIGASELATICGVNPYESAVELWQKRTGLKPPAPENENMRRGHDLEPIVRDRFMKVYGWAFDLKYDEFGMWFNDQYPHQFATLDGILISKVDGLVRIGGEEIEFHVGDEMILEIKNPEPKSRQDYYKWETKPNIYAYQAAGQIMASGIKRHLLLANITGQYQQNYPVDERYFYSEAPAYSKIIAEIAETVPAFWNMQTTRTLPPQAVDLAEVVFTATPTVGEIVANFAEVKASIEQSAKRYEGLTFTEEQATDAKKTRSELNKAIKQIEDVRTAAKKKWNEPLAEFEKRCKELEGVIENVKTPIEDQITAFEKRAEETKKQLIADYIKAQLETKYNDIKPLADAAAKNPVGENILGVPFNARWLNSSYKINAVRKDIDDWCENIRKEYGMLYSLKDSFDAELWNAVYAEYLASGLSVARALSRKAQILEAREIQKRMQEAAQKRAEATPAPVVEPVQETAPAQPAATPGPEQPKVTPTEKIYTKCVEFSHTNLKEFGGLIAYLKEHGFKCREVKEYK